MAQSRKTSVGVVRGAVVRSLLVLGLTLPAMALVRRTVMPTTHPTPTPLVAAPKTAGAAAAANPVVVANTTTTAANPADAFFDPLKLHTVHLKLSAKAFQDIQPTRSNAFAQLFAATRPTSEEAKHESPFGYEYAYVHAAIECDGTALDDVGLRYKGNSSYLIGHGLKKPFKVDLNRYDKDLSLWGLSMFNLHNNAWDPTHLRESMSYQFFRDAGVPACRTSFALVYLTVAAPPAPPAPPFSPARPARPAAATAPKEHDHELVGLYAVVEEVNKAFLKEHFGSARGLLMKPENAFDLPYMGEDFARYEKVYRPKSEYTKEQSARLIGLTKLIHKADDATFERDIERYLDVDAFLRFVATNALLANMDSFLSTGHNFYLYVHPDTLKVHFVPWDLNLSFGTFDWVGSITEQADLSVRRPYVKPNRLTERVLSIDRYYKTYRAEIDRLTRDVFVPDRLVRQITQMEAVVARAERLANVPHKPLPTQPAREIDLKLFVARRAESVQAQLTDTRPGYRPYWQSGLFGRGNNPNATQPATRPAPAAKKPAATPDHH